VNSKFRLICYAALLGLFCLNASAGNYGEIAQLYKKGQKDKALEMLDAYLGKLPNDAWGRNVTQARFLKGVILAEQKRTQDAIRIFTKLTQDYPALPEPYNNLAALYAAQGQYEAARDVLERALHTNPSYSTAHDNLNDIYAKLSSQAYDSTLGSSKSSQNGKPTPVLIKELCDNYGKMASQVAGRKTTVHSVDDLVMLHDINLSQTSATKPPAKINIDEMALAPTGPAAETPENNAPAPQSKPTTPAAAAAKAGKAQPDTTTPTPPTELDKDGSAEDRRAILLAVRNWASAWSKKNTGAYLAFYARDFKIPDGQPRSQWESLRKERIAKPKSIKVAVDNPRITFLDGTHARLGFRQIYRSDTLQTETSKTLLMVKSGSRWLIQEEKVNG